MNDFPIGWLAPDGSFVKCGCFEHISVAKELVDKFYPNEPSSHYDEVLLEKGWVHIGISAIDHQYYFWWYKFLTEPQRHFMKPYFETDKIDIFYSAVCKWDREMDGC